MELTVLKSFKMELVLVPILLKITAIMLLTVIIKEKGKLKGAVIFLVQLLLVQHLHLVNVSWFQMLE